MSAPLCPATRLPHRTVRLPLGAAGALLALSATAWAIPSPDVMVNLFASSAQLLGLASVVLGRWVWVRRRRGAAGDGEGRRYRTSFLVAAGLCALSTIGWGLYAAQVADERNERLQVNLNRNSREEGKKIVDVSLRELSFSGQLERKDGLPTDELLRRLESGRLGQVLDVREDEEFEVGAIEGATHARFPDVAADPERFIDRAQPVVLMCFNGNRSSELAEELTRRGFQAGFVVGGYEKWIAEDRPIAFNMERERRDLREIPDYPNKDVLLDTPDVIALVQSRDIQFLDVRYPGEYDLAHLAGAINVPFRKMVTPELDAALAALPKKPIVVACYDKRSSFFGLVVGLRLTRMGYEFVGRYTTPESYAVPGKDKAHVAAWQAANEPKTLLTLASSPLAGSLTWTAGQAGSLALGILILVLLVRLAVLPLTARAERDRRTESALRTQIDALRQRFASDRGARAQATMDLLKRHGVKPAWNALSSIAQILLFTVFFGVVAEASRGSDAAFLWLPALGEPDPRWILPVASAVLMGLLVWLPAARKTWKRAVGSACAAAVILALVAPLAAGPQIYLVASLGLVHVHNLLIGAWLGWRARAPARRRAATEAQFGSSTIVPLRHAHVLSGCGGKATRLGRLIEAGIRVPDGFVVRAAAFAGGRLGDRARADVLAAHARLGAARVAVRSSGANEDGVEKSYAGVFESILDVEANGLEAAIERVARSWTGARVEAYSNGASENGAIVVQAMVPAEWAGVLFTEHPGESGTCAVEMVAGLGDELVSGRAEPQGYRVGRASGRVLDGARPPVDLAPLFELGRRVEALFGGPQDVEWAFAHGRFFLLQARDVTRVARTGGDERALRERERHRLLAILRGTPAKDAVLVQNELSELLPEPTPLSLSLMESLWGYDGSTHRACASLGIPYDVGPDSEPLLVTAFGKLYVDQRESRRRVRRAPSALAAFRLARNAERMEQDWRLVHLPRAARAARIDAALDLGRLTLEELVTLFRERERRFVTEDYVRAEEVNLAADVYMKTAVRELGRHGLDAAEQLAHLPTTVVQEGAQLLARCGRGESGPEAFLEHSGHRAPHDWELSTARYAEDDEVVQKVADRSRGMRPHALGTRVPLASRVLDLAVERALRWQVLKEEAKHLALRDLAFLRRLAVALGERSGLGEQVFLLRCDEVARLDDAAWRANVALELLEARSDERAALAGVRLPCDLSAAFLEELDASGSGAIPRAVPSGALCGTRVSGRGGVIGRARVLREPSEIASFQDGEILVARFTDPNWMPLFSRARAIVTEVGGWLSHAAIQAREHGLPAIVGVRGALDAIATGDLVRLAPDGSVELVPDRRIATRRATAIEVVVRSARAQHRGRLSDVSDRGALLDIGAGRLEMREGLTLDTSDGRSHMAIVVRNGIPGLYGLEMVHRVEP